MLSISLKHCLIYIYDERTPCDELSNWRQNVIMVFNLWLVIKKRNLQIAWVFKNRTLQNIISSGRGYWCEKYYNIYYYLVRKSWKSIWLTCFPFLFDSWKIMQSLIILMFQYLPVKDRFVNKKKIQKILRGVKVERTN